MLSDPEGPVSMGPVSAGPVSVGPAPESPPSSSPPPPGPVSLRFFFASRDEGLRNLISRTNTLRRTTVVASIAARTTSNCSAVVTLNVLRV